MVWSFKTPTGSIKQPQDGSGTLSSLMAQVMSRYHGGRVGYADGFTVDPYDMEDSGPMFGYRLPFSHDQLRGFPNGIGFDTMEQTSTRDPGSSAPDPFGDMINGAIRNSRGVSPTSGLEDTPSTTGLLSEGAREALAARRPALTGSPTGLTMEGFPGVVIGNDGPGRQQTFEGSDLPFRTENAPRSPFAPPADPRSTRQTYTPIPPPELTPLRERPERISNMERVYRGMTGESFSPRARDVTQGLGDMLGYWAAWNPQNPAQAAELAVRQAQHIDSLHRQDQQAAQLHDQLRQTRHHQTETERERAARLTNATEHQLETERLAALTPQLKMADALMGADQNPEIRTTPEYKALVQQLLRADKGETALATARAKNTAEAEQAARASMESSQKQIGDLDQMAAIANNPGVYFGPGGQMINQARALARSMGLNIGEGAPEGEVFNSLARQMALQLRNPAGGAGMPGAMSDQDRNFLESMVPGLNRTREGNQLLLQMWREKEAHKLAESQERLRFMEANGSQQGLQPHMAQWQAKNQAISNATRERVQQYRSSPQGRTTATTAAQEGALEAANDTFKKATPEQQAAAIAQLRKEAAEDPARAVERFNARFSTPGSGLAESLVAQNLTEEQKAALAARRQAGTPQQQPGSQQPRGILEEMLNPTPTPLGNWLREKLGVPPVPIPGQPQPPQPTPNVRGPQ